MTSRSPSSHVIIQFVLEPWEQAAWPLQVFSRGPVGSDQQACLLLGHGSSLAVFLEENKSVPRKFISKCMPVSCSYTANSSAHLCLALVNALDGRTPRFQSLWLRNYFWSWKTKFSHCVLGVLCYCCFYCFKSGLYEKRIISLLEWSVLECGLCVDNFHFWRNV